jgi:ABC-type branched-subunit amino acid transport system substrate-binding protein
MRVEVSRRSSRRASLGMVGWLVAAVLMAACGSRVTNGTGPQALGLSAPPEAVPPATPTADDAASAPVGAVPETAAPPGTDANLAAPTPRPTSAPRSMAGSGGNGQSERSTTPAAARTDSGSTAGKTAPTQPAISPVGTSKPGVQVDGPDSQGVSASEIKIGVLAPLSGAAGFLGEVEAAAVRAYYESVNAQGGVHGRKYRLVVLDTQFEPTVEATATRRLVDQDKVFALLSILADSSAPYITSKGIPAVTMGATPVSFSSRYPTVYPTVNIVDLVAQHAYQLTQVLKKPIKSVALLYDTQNLPIGPWAKYMAKAWEIWGVDVKSMDPFNLSNTDCTQLVVKMKQLAIDFWSHAQSLGWPICEQAMARQQWYPPQGRGGVFTPDAYFVAQTGPSGNGVIANNMGPQISRNFGEPWPYGNNGKNPYTDAFVQSMKRFSPRNSDTRSLESAWAQLFWTQAKLVDDALRAQAGALTWKGVNQWIQGQKAWAGGLLSPVSFVPNCKKAVSGSLFEWKYTGQQFEQSDWQPWGGMIQLPAAAKEKIFPGAGECYETAMADAEL